MWQVAMVLDNTAKNYQSYFQNTSFSKKKKKETNTENLQIHLFIT